MSRTAAAGRATGATRPAAARRHHHGHCRHCSRDLGGEGTHEGKRASEMWRVTCARTEIMRTSAGPASMRILGKEPATHAFAKRGEGPPHPNPSEGRPPRADGAGRKTHDATPLCAEGGHITRMLALPTSPMARSREDLGGRRRNRICCTLSYGMSFRVDSKRRRNLHTSGMGVGVVHLPNGGQVPPLWGAPSAGLPKQGVTMPHAKPTAVAKCLHDKACCAESNCTLKNA